MLTESIIRKTQPKGSDSKLFDFGGLFLLIRSTGHRGWRFKYRVNSHEKLLSFGPYPTVSTQAVALLKDIQPATGDGKYVFPSPRSRTRPLSNVALLAALRRMGYEQGTLTVHGFRTTASTLLNEQGWRPDAIERQLAHGERDHVRAVYNHAEYLRERKLMMQDWADFLDELKNARIMSDARRA